jgi:NitT/TauT family transport system substrate-binding protein
MPDLTGLPFLVAEREGLFAARGVEVRLTVFKSALERTAALQAGLLDGCNADAVALVLARKGGFGMVAAFESPNRFSFVAAPGKPASLAAMSGARVGISRATVIEYLMDAMLSHAGASPAQAIDIPRIPDRLALLLQGGIDGAILPLPFDELARESGCAVIADSAALGIACDLFMFDERDLAKRPAAYKAMMAAISEAALRIDRDPGPYRAILSEKLGFSEAQARSIAIPLFGAYRAMPLEAIAEATRWALGKGLISEAYEPESLSTDLPGR